MNNQIAGAADQELIRRLQEGDKEALCELIDKYGNYVARILSSFLGSGLTQEDLEECTSDVFFALWTVRVRLKEDGNLKAYIVSVAKNTGRKRLRSCKVTELLPEEFPLLSDELDPEESAEEQEQRVLLRSLLQQMNSLDREIFYRHYCMGQKAEEIAGEIGCKRGTVLSRLFRGRKYLKKELTDHGIIYDGRNKECLR